MVNHHRELKRALTCPRRGKQSREIATAVDHADDIDRDAADAIEDDGWGDDNGTYAGRDLVAGGAGIRKRDEVRYCEMDVPKMGVGDIGRET